MRWMIGAVDRINVLTLPVWNRCIPWSNTETRITYSVQIKQVLAGMAVLREYAKVSTEKEWKKWLRIFAMTTNHWAIDFS